MDLLVLIIKFISYFVYGNIMQSNLNIQYLNLTFLELHKYIIMYIFVIKSGC